MVTTEDVGRPTPRRGFTCARDRHRTSHREDIPSGTHIKQVSVKNSCVHLTEEPDGFPETLTPSHSCGRVTISFAPAVGPSGVVCKSYSRLVGKPVGCFRQHNVSSPRLGDIGG